MSRAVGGLLFFLGLHLPCKINGMAALTPTKNSHISVLFLFVDTLLGRKQAIVVGCIGILILQYLAAGELISNFANL